MSEAGSTAINSAQTDTPNESIAVFSKYVTINPSNISAHPSPTVSNIERKILPKGISKTNENTTDSINHNLEEDFHFI